MSLARRSPDIRLIGLLAESLQSASPWPNECPNRSYPRYPRTSRAFGRSREPHSRYLRRSTDAGEPPEWFDPNVRSVNQRGLSGDRGRAPTRWGSDRLESRMTTVTNARPVAV